MCASSGIVSALWNTLLVSESPPESVAKADSLGREDDRTGILSFLVSSGGSFSGEGAALTFAVFPDEPDADRSLASLAEVHPPPVVVVVDGRRDRARRAPVLRSLGCWRHGVLQCREVGVDKDAAFHRVTYGLFG